MSESKVIREHEIEVDRYIPRVRVHVEIESPVNSGEYHQEHDSVIGSSSIVVVGQASHDLQARNTREAVDINVTIRGIPHDIAQLVVPMVLSLIERLGPEHGQFIIGQLVERVLLRHNPFSGMDDSCPKH